MSVVTSHRRGPLAVLAVLLSIGLVTAACGTSTQPASSSSDTGSAQELLGPKNTATGKPVKIGWVSTGQTKAIDTTDMIRAAEATVAYANDRLGGLSGRPIELVTCQGKGTPAGAQACGNKFVEEGVAAVALASLSNVDAILQVVAPAGIPVAANFAATKAMLMTDRAFVFRNALTAFGTPAAYARANNVDSAKLLVIQVPGAAGPAKRFAPIFYANAGSSVDVVTIPPGTADMTPQVAAAASDNPEMWQILGDPTFCASAIQAIRTLGTDAPIVADRTCLGDNVATSIPGGFEGVTITTRAVTSPDSEAFQRFTAVLEQYGDGLPVSNDTIAGYQTMLSLIRAVNASKNTELSPAGITKALRMMPPTPTPLGGGLTTFQCDGQAMPDISPNICSDAGLIADASADGTLSNFRTVDSKGIYQIESK